MLLAAALTSLRTVLSWTKARRSDRSGTSAPFFRIFRIVVLFLGFIKGIFFDSLTCDSKYSQFFGSHILDRSHTPSRDTMPLRPANRESLN